jgi:hypothetical protein
MIIAQILTIIELSLRLALRIAEDMPESERQAHWARHARWMEFWEGLLRRQETP